MENKDKKIIDTVVRELVAFRSSLKGIVPDSIDQIKINDVHLYQVQNTLEILREQLQNQLADIDYIKDIPLKLADKYREIK